MFKKFKKSRIDELADQCENWYETSEGYDLDFDYSKFARLIIEDCSKALLQSQYENAKSEYYEGFNEALRYGSQKIKDEFGVE